MAAAKKVLGPKPDKILRDALLIAVNREVTVNGAKSKRITLIAEKLADQAVAGEIQAIKEVWDRIEGKPAQAIALGQDPDKEPVTFKWEG